MEKVDEDEDDDQGITIKPIKTGGIIKTMEYNKSSNIFIETI